MATSEQISQHLNVIGRPDLLGTDRARHQAEVYLNVGGCKQLGSLTCYPCIELGVQICDGQLISKLAHSRVD